MVHWTINPCCEMWMQNNPAPTTCPECDTEFVVTVDFEVWPAFLLNPHVAFIEDVDGEQN